MKLSRPKREQKRIVALTPYSLDENKKGITFDQFPEIERDKVGSFIRGYVKAALTNSGFEDSTINDLDEATMLQICRDCASFLWRNDPILEALLQSDKEYNLFKAGKDFWVSRNLFDKQGFRRHKHHGPSTSRLLHESARNSYSRCWLESIGFEIIQTWEDPNEFEFDLD